MSTRHADVRPGYKGGTKRTLTLEMVLERLEQARALPEGEQRQREVKRARDAVRRVTEYRRD